MRFTPGKFFGALSALALLVSSNPLREPDAVPHYLQRRYQPTVEDLKQTALDFVTDVKALDQANGGREVVIVGGTALAIRYPGFRNTPDVDLVLKSGRPPPKSIKEMLKKKFGNKYDTRPDGFYYTLAPGKQINIDVIDGGMQTFVFNSYKPLSAINSINDLPVASDSEIVVTKIEASGERDKPPKAIQDAKDAQHVVQNGHMDLTVQQKASVSPLLAGVAQKTSTQISWWQQKLGVQQSRSPTPPHEGPTGPTGPQQPVGPKRRDLESATRERIAKLVVERDFESRDFRHTI